MWCRRNWRKSLTVEWPPRVLWPEIAEINWIFALPERLRAFRKCIFHKRGRRENILHNFLQGEVINGSSSLRERVFGAARRLRQTRNKS